MMDRGIVEKGRVARFLLASIFFLHSLFASANVVIIGNRHFPIDHLSKQQVIALYKGKTMRLPNGFRVIPYDQLSRSKSFGAFYQNLFGWNLPDVHRNLSEARKQSHASLPLLLENDQQAVHAVLQTTNAIAYVNSDSVVLRNSGVKVLFGKTSINTVSSFSTPVAQLTVRHSLHPEYAQQNFSHVQPIKFDKTPVQRPVFSDYISNKKLNGNVWAHIRRHFALGDFSNRSDVQYALQWYISHPLILNHILQNATPYLAYVYLQTREHRMPSEFALLPLVESGYSPFAYSKAGAAGLWQIMPTTAPSYHLHMNWWDDARFDIVDATEAALTFLTFLHNDLHSWMLAAAAYDTGERRVQNAQLRNQYLGMRTDYWHLPLAEETRNYLPKLFALTEIVKNPARYGVTLPYISSVPYFTRVTIHSQLDWAAIAQYAQTPITMIRRLNPNMRRWATDPDNHTTTILIPSNMRSTFFRNFMRMSSRAHLGWRYHAVRSGESLTNLARHYHTSPELLRWINGLSDDSMLGVAQGILVPMFVHGYAVRIAHRSHAAYKKTLQKDASLRSVLHNVYRQ